MTAISTTPPAVTATASRPGVARVRTAAAALATASLTVAGLLATKPWGDRLDSGADDFLVYDKLLEVRDAAWISMLVDGFAYAVIGFTVGLGVLHLARDRGRVAALVGAVLTTAGGILFAIGAGAFATFGWFATAPGLPDGAGRSLVDYANDHVGHVVGADMLGFVTYTLGSLVLAAAAIRARAVPVVAVAVFVVLTLLQFVMPAGHDVLNYLQIVMMLMLAGLAAVVWRRA
jgi:hypothetical protein